MTHLIIDNKKYVLIPEENYQKLQKTAALKREPEKTLSIDEARVYSKQLIRKWASEFLLVPSSRTCFGIPQDGNRHGLHFA